MCNEYNGYINYPTWCVSLWLNNEQNLYNLLSNKAKELCEEKNLDKIKLLSGEIIGIVDPKHTLGKWIKNTFCEDVKARDYNINSKDINMMLTDLLTFSIGIVDFSDIAEGFLNDLEEYKNALIKIKQVN